MKTKLKLKLTDDATESEGRHKRRHSEQNGSAAWAKPVNIEIIKVFINSSFTKKYINYMVTVKVENPPWGFVWSRFSK